MENEKHIIHIYICVCVSYCFLFFLLFRVFSFSFEVRICFPHVKISRNIFPEMLCKFFCWVNLRMSYDTPQYASVKMTWFSGGCDKLCAHSSVLGLAASEKTESANEHTVPLGFPEKTPSSCYARNWASYTLHRGRRNLV